MLSKLGLTLVTLGVMMGDSEDFILPAIVIGLGFVAIYFGGGFRNEEQIEEG